MIRKGLRLLVSAALAAGLCAGCQKKFTRPRYETIYIGMPASSVERTLGEPTLESGETWSYINEEPFYQADISFAGGRVTRKAWYDEREASGQRNSFK